MRIAGLFPLWIVLVLLWQTSFAQPDRITYNDQPLFLSGANLAWISFANDIGPDSTNVHGLADIMLQMHDHGGNALRWWLHTNGVVTPQYDASGFVIGPGEGTLQDLKQVLDLAWEREIGLKLCLWSFDMLRSSNSAVVLNRNIALLSDTTYIRAYIDNCLVPMVDSLRGHPAIIAWEIFNEPEGMSDEHGWPDIQHVPMAWIQRFINLCAGAIHRTDTAAQVTNGSWSFYALTDVPLPSSSVAKLGSELAQLSPAEKAEMEARFFQKYGVSLTLEQIVRHMEQAARQANLNYYTDSRLIAAGGDPDGTLDFYSVHYYDWGGTSISPFHHPVYYWGLDKALVVAEFAMKDTYGVLKEALYDTLYQKGYAGALAWSWTNPQFSTSEDMLAAMQSMWDAHREDVDVQGIGGDWPLVTITSPDSGATFPDSAEITIVAEATDTDGSVVLVEFFANDTLKIGERDTVPYAISWTEAPTGLHGLTAVATDNQGHQRISRKVYITVGTPTMVRLEAESAVLSGTPTRRGDVTASKGAYVTMQQTGTITWTLPSVPAAGSYEIVFGFRLSYDHPKSQFINVNGVRVAEVVFDGLMNVWLEKKLTVDLRQGSNVIQMELSWGWMDLDYMAVPATLVTSVSGSLAGLPDRFSVQQNYPNPFNSSTTIAFSIPQSGEVTVEVFNQLGQKVAVLMSGSVPAGAYRTQWNAAGVASGAYYYRIQAGRYIETKRMTLLK